MMKPAFARALGSLACIPGSLVFAVFTAHAGPMPDRILTSARERAEKGVVVVIAMADSGRSEVQAFGTLPDGSRPDGDTVFEIGSVTKTFTATLLAEAIVSGHVKADEPIATLLPGWTLPSRDGKEITLEDIATQRSGLPRLPTNLAPADSENPYADYDAAKLKSFLAGYQLTRDPGASYEYSNLAFGLLGYALAGDAHTDYGTLVKRTILDPLGMTMSGTTITDSMRTHLAPGHAATGNPAKNWDLDALSGAGALKSTGNDMLRYLRANMGAARTPLAAAMTLAQTPCADAATGTRIGYAWMTSGNDVVWHNGMTGGYASFVGFTGDRRRGVVILTNEAETVDDLGMAALDSSAPLAPVREAITMSADDLDAYDGIYRLAPGFDLRVFRTGDQVYAQATGQGAIQLFASAPNEFFAKVAPISITFERDAKGAVSGLVLHQNGDHAAPRLPDEATVSLDAQTLAGYVGRYQLAPGAIFDITLKDGTLYAQLTGQPALPVYASAKDRFFYKAVDARIDFERGPDAQVDALVLHQNGRDLRAPRLAN